MANLESNRLSADWSDRYLRLLGVEREAPSPDALTRLERAHIGAVPFCNVSSILRRGGTSPNRPVSSLDPEAVLASWIKGDAGGVCFETSGMLCRLLVSLGYEAHQVMANASFPGSHQAVLVKLGGTRYLVDAGNGAPFSPVPLDGEHVIRHVGLGYRFHAGELPQTWQQERWIDDAWTLFCTYELTEPTPDVLEATYQRHHTPGRSWVVDELRVVRCSETDVKAYRSGRFTHYTADGKHSQQVSEPSAVARLVAETFGLPRLPVEEALRAQAAFSVGSN